MTPYWQDEKRGLTIYHADCREVLPTFADGEFGSVVTDPPYGIGFADWDIPPDSAILQECLRVSEGSVVMFASAKGVSVRHFVNLDPAPERMMVWAPIRGRFLIEAGMHRHVTPIWVWRQEQNAGVLPQDLLRERLLGRHDGNDRHIARKPCSLMMRLIRQFGGRSTLDPYMGSGTTLVAAEKLGIPATGIEISERYCEMARVRLEGGFMDDEPAHLFNQEALTHDRASSSD